MQESIVLSPNLAREFLNEFVASLFDVVVAREEKRIEREKEKALEKVKLIERQFPGTQIARREEHLPVTTAPTRTTPQVSIGIEKIDTFLADQNIDLIECSNSRIRIRKDGKLQETGFTFGEVEIREIIKRFSEKTRIPIAKNFLHATLGNVSINAIISGLIGSRFLIAKGA